MICVLATYTKEPTRSSTTVRTKGTASSRTTSTRAPSRSTAQADSGPEVPEHREFTTDLDQVQQMITVFGVGHSKEADRSGGDLPSNFAAPLEREADRGENVGSPGRLNASDVECFKESSWCGGRIRSSGRVGGAGVGLRDHPNHTAQFRGLHA